MRDRYASLREGLVGAWIPSISGSGLLLPDLSGQGNNGTLTNMGPEDWVSGQYGRALDFDGSNDKVSNIGNLGSFSFIQNTGVFAIAFWAKFDSDNTRLTALGNELASVSKGFFVIREYLSPFGFNCMRVIVFRGTAGQFLVTGTTDDSTALFGSWNHWAYTSDFSDNIGQWFRDGVAINTTSKPGDSIAGSVATGDSTRSLSIGLATFTSDILHFDGQLDDIRIYNRALSESEIKLLSQEPGVGFKRSRRVFDFGRKPAYLPPTPPDYRTVRVKQAGEHASLREGLVGAWCPSVAGEGYTLPDLSGQGNNGTLTNMDASDWVSGQYGRALDFDGVNDYVAVNDNAALSPLSQISIAFWAKPTALPAAANGNRMWAVTKGDTNNFEYECSINSFSTSFGKWNCAYYNLAGNGVRGRASVVDAIAGEWQHVCWTAKRDGSFPDMYFNGNLSNGSTISFLTPTAGDGTAQLQIGRRANASDVTFNGQLDDVRIYNRALSEPEIKLLASRPGIGLRPQRRNMYYAPPNRKRNNLLIGNLF